MKKHIIVLNVSLVIFIIMNFLVNFISGGINPLLTVFFYASFCMALVALYFIINEIVKKNVNKIPAEVEDKVLYAKENNLVSKKSFFISYDKEFEDGIYFTWKFSIILSLISIPLYFSFGFFKDYTVIQYQYLILIIATILAVQVVVKLLVELKIIKVKLM